MPVLPESRALPIETTSRILESDHDAGAGPESSPAETTATETAEEQPANTASPRLNTSFLMVKILRERMQASPLDDKTWCLQISQISGVSEKLVTGLVGGNRDFSLQTARKLIPKMAVADAELRHDATLMVVEVLRKHRDLSTLDEKSWRKHVAQGCGISETLIKELVGDKKDLSAQTAKKLVPYLWS